MRGADQARTYGGGDADELPARGALGTRLQEARTSRPGRAGQRFRIEAIARPPTAASNWSAGERRVVADTVVNSTGFRPDHDIVGELRLDLDPILGSTRALAPLIDPNQHSCGTVPPHGVDELAHPEPGYYAVGAKSYGRAPTFLLATGYEQARSVVAALAGDWDAARDVQLDLPETGVCSTNLTDGDRSDEAGGCCGPAPQAVEISAPAGRGLATGISGGLLTVIEDNSSNQSGCCS